MKLLVIIICLFTINTFASKINLNVDNTVVFRGEFTNESVNVVQKKLHNLVKIRGSKTYKIYLVMDSPGGSIVAGATLIEFLKTIPNVDTITIFAASMAAGVVQANSGRRYITESGTLMFHRASGGLFGQFENGEVESRLAYLKSTILAMEVKNAVRMKMSLEAYKKAIINEYWLFSGAAVHKGAADELSDIICSSELIDKSDIQTVMVMGIIPLKISYSYCPLFRFPELLGDQSARNLEAFDKYKNSLGTNFEKQQFNQKGTIQTEK